MTNEEKNLNNEDVVENENVEDQNDNDDASGKSGDDKSNGNEKKEAKEKTFTQEQVNRMMTREKNQGRNSVYKELGIDPKDTKSIAMVKAMLDSQKTDEERDAEKRSENESKITEAEQRAVFAEAKAEAMVLGVKTQYVDDVVTLALSKMTEDSDLKTIIGEFKTKYPVWFGESEKDDDDADDKNKTGKKGTGSSIKTVNKSKNESDAKGLGARLAAQRKSGSSKGSYWGRNK